jgi:hypothetical protein
MGRGVREELLGMRFGGGDYLFDVSRDIGEEEDAGRRAGGLAIHEMRENSNERGGGGDIRCFQSP